MKRIQALPEDKIEETAEVVQMIETQPVANEAASVDQTPKDA